MTTKISTANLDASITTLIGSGGGPKVTSISYPGNDLAADIAGGQTVTVTGTGFVAGCSVFVGTVQASVVTVVSATTVTFTTPALAVATYILYLVNPDGGTATIVPGISYSGTPVWTTAAGSLGSAYEYSAVSNSIAATGDGSITYSVLSGTLPTGSSLNASTGTITGTSPASAGATTYTFVIRATDAQLQDTDRTFSITINTDAVTWTTPAANSTVTLAKDAASTTALLATSAAGKAITYTSTTLPTGLTISGATVTGTPTVTSTTAVTFTATAATTNKTATAIINWTVSVAADLYFPYTTLLLSGGTSTSTFIADASTNNFAVTIAGDTKPNNFNPYTPGYYSVYSNNTGVLSGVTTTTISAGVFTFEGWFNLTAVTAVTFLMGLGTNTGGPTPYFNVSLTSSGTVINVECYSTASAPFIFNANYTWPLNRWVHLAAVGNGTTVKVYVNGVGLTTTLGSGTFPGSYLNTLSLYPWVGGLLFGGGGARADGVNGYVSNFRFVNGTAVYTADFTPSATPLTAISGTAMLACQSNRLIDSNNVSLTKAGNLTVNPTNPFVPNTQYAAYGSTYFDGTTDSLTITPAQASLGLGTGDFTVECWAYRTAVSNYQVIIKLNDYSNGLVVRTESPGYNDNFYYVGVGYDWNPTLNFPANTWTHICVTRQSGTLRLFVNGIIIVSVTNTSNMVLSPAEIGSNGYIGYISNIRVVKGTAVYATAGTTIGATIFTPPTAPLTAVAGTSLLTCQTNQPVNNSVFLDNSTNAFAVTRVANTSAGTFTPYGANWSNYFDGSGDVFTVPNNSGFNFSSDFIIEAWLHPTAFGQGSCNFMTHWSGSSNVYVFRVLSNGRVQFLYTAGGATLTGTSTTVLLNQWSHVALCRSGGILRIFVNGIADTTTANYSGTLTGGGLIAVGAHNDASEGWTGYISNLRVVNTPSAPYTTTFTPSTTPLTSITGTALLTCQSNSLVDNSANAGTITKTGQVAVQRFSPFSPQTQTAITHSAYFDGATDYLTAPSSSQFNLPGDFTIECWIHRTVNVDIIGLFGIGSTDPDSNLVRINSGVLQFWLGGSNSGASGTGTKTGQINCSTVLLFNTWYHVALVRSGSAANNVKLYLNGVLDGQGTGTYQVPTNSFVIGKSYPGYAGEHFNGYISNVRIVKGVAVYTGTFTPPATPLSATQSSGTNIAAVTGTQTSLLTCQSPTFVDNSTNAFAITAFGDTKPRTYNPFGFTNTLAAYSAATYGGSAYFDGTGDYLTTPSSSLFNLNGINWTVEGWFNLVSATSDDRLFVFAGASGSWGFYRRAATGNLYFGRFGYDEVLLGNMLLNEWTHLALVRTSGPTISLYKNGVFSASTAAYSMPNENCTFLIAGNPDPYTNTVTKGYVSDVRVVKGTAVYTSAFTPPTAPLTAITNTSLLLNMTSAGVYDSASMNNLETVADAKIVATHTPYAGSYYSNLFNGAGDYLTVATNAVYNFGTGDFTLEAWIYRTASGSDAFIMSASGSGGLFWGVPANGDLGWGRAGVAWDYQVASGMVINTWYHVALTRSGTSMKMFVNGAQLGVTQTLATSYNISTTSLTIGSQGANYYFTGYISNARIVKGTAVYTGTFAVPSAPLTATQAGNGATISAITGSATSLLTCQSNRFVDNSSNLFAITRAGSTSVQSFNPFQRNSATTMYFDGTGDYLNAIPNVAFTYGTGSFTIEGWHYLTAASSATKYLFDQRVSGNGYFPALYVSGGQYIVYINSATPVVAGTVVSNTWVHWALVKNSSTSTTTLYINGTQAGSFVDTNNYSVIAQFRVGSEWTTSGLYDWQGYINDLRITKGVARYTTTFTPPTTAFIAR